MKTASLRFATIRDAEPAPPIICSFPFNPSVLTSEADYNQSLFKKLDTIHKNAALKPEAKVKEIRNTVAAFKSSSSFISNNEQFERQYPRFVEFRDWMTSRKGLTVADINRQAEKVLEFSARRTLPAKELLTLTDNLIAQVISNDDPRLREQISFALRINNIVQKVETVRGAVDLRKLIAAPVILPDVVFLPNPAEEKKTEAAPKEDPALADRQRNWEKLNRLSTAYDELVEARGMQIEAKVEPVRKTQRPGPLTRFFSRFFRTPPEPPEPPQNDFTSSNLRKEHLASLSAPTMEMLNELRITQETTFADALSKVERRAQDVATQIGMSISPYTERVMIGNALVNKVDINNRYVGSDQKFPDSRTKGECEYKFPFKIADLRIVDQELKDYLAGEVAHVENILQGELKERSTQRTETTEETLFTSAEREEENLTDTTTTNRFQLEQEISKTVKQDSELEVNAKVDTQYYGYVNVQGSVSAGFSTSNSEEQSTREAVTYAKDVVERSAQKIIERVKEERTFKTTKKFEENNRHILNNVGGQHHVVGVYRWLNKEYKVWLKNYGKRLMFELLIPEPAAYHLYAMTQKKDGSLGDLKEPVAPNDPELAKGLGLPAGFVLSSYQSITEFNYHTWAAAYGAEITPPPASATVATALVKTDGTQIVRDYVNTDKAAVTVPTGYVAQTCSVFFDYYSGPLEETHAWGMAIVGRKTFGGSQSNVTMDGETGTIPVTIEGFNFRMVIHVEVVCVPTKRTIDEWKIKTYKAIIDAYEAKKAEYQNAVAEARAGAGVVIRGTNPLFNKTIIQTELKKNAIRLMTHCNPLSSSAMTDAEGGFDCCQVMAEAPYIKFVEQIFEWRNMVYEFYPYHWAATTHWTDLYNLSDTDPLFQNFLKAGYARILVPVTPGYNLAATNFVTLGTPDLNDLAALPVIDIINGMDEDAPTVAPARVSTQADIDLANPGATIDGVTMVAGDRVLVRHQTLKAENGVYIWNGSSTPMTRATDADAPVELAQAVIAVTEGTDKGFTFRQTELPLTTIGTDDIIFQIAAEVINESLLLPTDLTILECKSAGVEPTTMKILGLCETAGTMTPVLGGGSSPSGDDEAEEPEHHHEEGDGH